MESPPVMRSSGGVLPSHSSLVVLLFCVRVCALDLYGATSHIHTSQLRCYRTDAQSPFVTFTLSFHFIYSSIMNDILIYD